MSYLKFPWMWCLLFSYINFLLDNRLDLLESCIGNTEFHIPKLKTKKDNRISWLSFHISTMPPLPEMITCPCLKNFSYLRFSLDLHSWAMLYCAKSRKNMSVYQQYRDIDVYEAGNLIFQKKNIVEVVRKISFSDYLS